MINDFPQSKKYTKPDKTVVYVWDGKYHRWDGPAVYNEENNIKEYYLYGIQYSEEEWKKAKKETNGIPWYKNPAFKTRH